MIFRPILMSFPRLRILLLLIFNLLNVYTPRDGEAREAWCAAAHGFAKEVRHNLATRQQQQYVYSFIFK